MAPNAIVGLLLTAAMGAADAPGPPVDGTALMAQAVRTVDLRATNGAPFRLQATFWIHEPELGKVRGHYELSWRSSGAWREEIDYPGHHRLSGKDASGPWIVPELPYRSLRFFDLANAIDVADFARVHEGDRIESVKARKGKVPVVQIRMSIPGQFTWSELSVDVASARLVKFVTGLPMSVVDFKVTHEFSDHRTWRDHQFPSLIKRFDGRHQVLELRVESLADIPDNDGMILSRPEAAVDDPICTPPELAAQVACDLSARQRVSVEPLSHGWVAARAVVARDGRLKDIVLVEKLNFVTDGSYRDSLTVWRCVPLTCGGAPVDAEILDYMELDGLR